MVHMRNSSQSLLPSQTDPRLRGGSNCLLYGERRRASSSSLPLSAPNSGELSHKPGIGVVTVTPASANPRIPSGGVPVMSKNRFVIVPPTDRRLTSDSFSGQSSINIPYSNISGFNIIETKKVNRSPYVPPIVIDTASSDGHVSSPTRGSRRKKRCCIFC